MDLWKEKEKKAIIVHVCEEKEEQGGECAVPERNTKEWVKSIHLFDTNLSCFKSFARKKLAAE